MNDTMLLYLVTGVGRAQESLVGVMIFCGFAMVGLGMAYLINSDGYSSSDEDIAATCAKWLKRVVVTFASCLVINLFLPSKSDVLLILAGSEVLKVARSETASRLTGKSVELLESMIDEQLGKKKAKP